MGAESFTVLAILEARDRASEIFAKVDESLDKFKETAKSAADTARGAGDAIDESLAQTASGADALDLASARVEAAQARQVQTAEALADAERSLLAVTQQEAATEEQVTAAADGVAAAQEKATATATELKDARASLKAAGATEDEAALAAATDRVAAADREAAKAAGELATAQARQASLNTSDNVTAAAKSLTKAEKTAKAASDDLTASQARQADVQKAVAASDTEAAAAAEAQATAQKTAADKAAATQDVLGKAGKIAGITALGMGVAAAIMVKAAGNFQSSTTHLVTDAGELPGQLAMVQAGILRVSTATGTAASEITNGMYHIESGGYHGAQGLGLLMTAAEGAKVGGADLDTVAFALAGSMNAYYGSTMSAAQATQRSTSMMNQLIATTSAGDLRMQDLASSLHSVAPLAATAHIAFSQVGGAIATMTAQGMSAQQATQDLGHTVGQLENPAKVAQKEMTLMGISASDVTRHLGQRGLTGTLAMLAAAAKAHAGAAGQSYAAAMSKMLNGTVGLNTSLMLTGTHLGDFRKNAATVAAAAKAGGGQVDNWAKIQSTFNFKMESAKTGIENTGIAIGSALLPAATSLLSTITSIVEPVAEWTANHRALTEILFTGATALAATVAAVILAKKAFDAVNGAVNTVKATMKALGLISRETGAAEGEAAAESSGSWAASAASTVASGARAAAGAVAKVAVMVASNVAGAAVSLAAWVVANAAMLLGIGLIVIAVVAAVALIVTHWKQISAFAEKAFHDVLSVVDHVIGWVKGHWPLLLAILTGPVGLAVLFIVEHYRQILRVIDSAISWVRGHWPLLLAILTGPVGLAVLFIVKHFDQIRDGAAHLIGQLVTFFGSLPGRIRSALGNLGSMLFGSGAKIIQGLINGLLSMVGGIGSAIGSVVSTIKSYLPFSPARQGPLAGPGDPSNSGRSIVRSLAKGLLAGTGDVTAASAHLAGAVAFGRGNLGAGGGGLTALGSSAGGAGGGGGAVVTIDLRGAQIMSDRDLDAIVKKIGPAVVRALGGAGYKVRMG